MSNYLQRKFVGKYRVLIYCDEETGDFIRNEDGSIDKTFDDFYIPCLNGGQISSVGGGKLQYYINNLRKGTNLLKEIKTSNDSLYREILSVEQTDSEISFIFRASSMDGLSRYLHPKTKGKNISPYSVKNLPKPIKYTIPHKDLVSYKEAIEEAKKSKGGFSWREAGEFTKTFMALLNSKRTTCEKIQEARKISRLKGKELVHYAGYWSEYLDFIKKGGV